MGFVDTSFARQCGVTLRTSQQRIALADGSVVRADGEITLSYTLAAKSGPPVQLTSTFVVTPLDPYQVILGMGWLEHHRVNVAYHERSMRLTPDGKGQTRFLRAVARVEDDGMKALSPLRLTAISDRALSRALRRGDIAQISAVFVRPTKHEDADPRRAFADALAAIPGGANPKVITLMKEFQASVFPEDLPPGVPPKRGVEHAIEFKPGSRIPQPRPLRHGSSKEAGVMQQYIDDGLRSGQLLPSTSPYGSLALVVLKKDGTPRVVIDYRAINEITVKNKYPLPLMDELFDRVVNAKWFTKIDLRSGFHQIAIRPEDREKTAFRTRYGSYEYTVLPMGLCNAPGTFMQLMNETFADMLDKSVLCFLDDILIFSRTEAEHEQHVRAVLRRLREKQLYAKLSKCEFFQQEVEFLGHRIGAEGLRVSPDKVGSIRDWVPPTDVTGVRSFLGLANFYRRFVKDYSRIALPLSELTKEKVVWRWDTQHQTAFDQLKAALCSPPVLIIPDQTKQFVLNCDACKFAIGAVLQQDHGKGLQPVAYFSAKLSDAERNYDVREREFMAIYRACLHWRPYLHSTLPFRLLSDHRSLTYYMSMPNLSDRLARWVEKMQQFNCGIEYIKGEENIPADALSRRHDYETRTVLNMIGVHRSSLLRVTAVKADEPDEVRQRHRDAANLIDRSPNPAALPPPDRNGTVHTPTQRCTANAKSGKQCGQRTTVGDLCWSHLQRDHGVRVKRSNVADAGRGLFVAKAQGLPEGHVVPYTGDLTQLDGIKGGEYMLELNKRLGIDAARRNAGVARFVNDPRGGKDKDGKPLVANCKFAVWTPRDGTARRMGAVRTLRPVLKGEELLVKYGNEYWSFYSDSQQSPKAERQRNVRAARRQPNASDRLQTSRKRRQPSLAARSDSPAACVPVTVTLAPLLPGPEPLLAAVKRAAADDADYSKLRESPPDGWIVAGVLLAKDSVILIPNDRALRTRILAEHHDSVIGAHAGRDRMLASVQQNFRWDGLAQDVEHYVATCDSCQRNKPSQQLKPGQLMPLPLPKEPCLHWTTDACTGIPTTKRGFDAIQVYVDRCTKLKHFVAVQKSDTAVDLANTTLRAIISQHGMPKSILSDRDPRISSIFWRELQRLLGSECVMSTANHPETDGLSENGIKTLIIALRAYCNSHCNDWDDFLPGLELAFNSKVHTSTGVSPFYLVYGLEPRLPVDCVLDEVRTALTASGADVPAAVERAERMKALRNVALTKSEQSQQRMKQHADRRRRLMELKVGDQVLLSTEGLKLRSGAHKLTTRYVGPFPVTDIVNENAVTLTLPKLLEALHSTFNISRLKLYRDGTGLFPGRPLKHTKPPEVEADTNGVKSYAVESVVAQRGSANRRELLVRWVGYGPEDDQWKPRRELLQSALKAVSDFDRLQSVAGLCSVTVTLVSPVPTIAG